MTTSTAPCALASALASFRTHSPHAYNRMLERIADDIIERGEADWWMALEPTSDELERAA